MSQLSSKSSNILSNILHGVIVTDSRGHILFWNDECKKILGFTFDEIKGKPIRVLYGDNEILPFKKIMQQSIEGKDVYGKWHAIHKRGTRVWLDVRTRMLLDNSGNIDLFLISICDIGKLIVTEKRLKKNRAISQAIFDTSLDAMITINKEACIVSVNRSAEEMFGYKKKELIGRNVKMLMPFPHNINHDNYLLKYLETGERRIMNSRRRTQGLKKSGDIFPIDLGVTEVTWEENRMITGVIRDLSSQHQLEQRLIEIGNEERRKIGRDLHDGLGQMLTGIRMLAESLSRKLQANALPAADEVKEIADMITEADQYARTLSRGMVQIDIENRGLIVAIQNLCKQTSKVTGVHCSVVSINEVEIENHIMALHIYRIIQEALSNAVKHGKATSVVIRLSRNLYHTSVSIDDDGVGFDPDVKENPGIGMQTMKYRVDLMSGVFEISRTADEWTRVRCIIPNNMNQF